MAIEGTDGDDVIVGTEGADVILGKAGADWISGTGGNDDIDPGSGLDHVDGGAGNDTVRLSSVYTSHGSEYGGGTGDDTLDLSAVAPDRYLSWYWTSATSAVVEDRHDYNDPKSVTVQNFEIFRGTDGYDYFNFRSVDGPLAVEVHGGGGNDFFDAMYNNLKIFGDEGDDYIIIGPGGSAYGGNGDDTIDIWASTYVKTDGDFDGGAGTDKLQLYVPYYTVDLAANTLSDAASTLSIHNFERVSVGVNTWVTATAYGDDGANTFEVNSYTNNGGGAAFHGRGGDDLLISGKGADLLDGGDGFDTASYETATSGVRINLAASGPQDTLAAGLDTLVSIEGVKGTAYGDVLIGGLSGRTTLDGGGGDDILYAGSGASRLSAGQGHDHLYANAAADVLDGGAGFDLARYDSSTQGVLVNLTSGAGAGGYAEGDSYAQIEGAVGSAFNDALFGDAANNVLYGQAGDDIVSGELGNDTLDGGDGGDHLYGGAGADSLVGGAGYDFARYDFAASAITVDLARGGFSSEAFGDSFSSIEGVVGSAFGDALTGDGGDNTLYGQAGDDVLRGEAGGDRLDGGVGNDHLYGGAGGDILIGGDGVDLGRYDASGSVRVDLSLGQGFTGEAAGDLLMGIEGVVGSGESDVLVGDAAANMLYGQAGDDQIWGGGGADVIDGGAGTDLVRFDLPGALGVVVDLKNGLTSEGDRLSGLEGVVATDAKDVLYGGDGGEVIYALGGDDRIVGGGGNDRLYGGAGADWFAFDNGSGSDLIMDFKAHGADHDVIAIQKNVNGSGIVDFASLLLHVQNTSATDMRVDLGGGAYIGLLDLHVADLSSDLFLFY